jgi:cell division protein FtsI (penicillin-binding protein 3)
MRPGIYKLLFLFLVFLGVTVGVAAKLIDLQILKHHHYSRLARRQHAFFRTIPAKRGTVYDRNMRQLAVTLPAYMVFADPMVLENPKDAAINIASAAGLEYRTLASRLSHRDSRFAIIDRTLDPEKARALKDMDVPGLYFEQSGERVRPLGDVGLNVLGRVSAEGEAQGGIESHYDTELRGEPGLRRYLRDAMGTPRPCVEAIVKTPVSGHSVVLAIDADLQAIAEKELDRAVLENGARGGCVVVVDPANGDILALASNPRDENFPVRTVFEPGSAFKICTIATGLDLGKVSTSSVFDTHNGILKVPGGWIRDDHPKKKLSLEEAVRRSSNVVASQVGRMIGKHDFYRSMRAFGFGSRTGIELGGEPRGIVRDPDEWSGRSLETLSIGQEIGVTAIQLTMAYAAVANGGTLLRPRLVKSIVDDNRHIRKKYPPKVVRTVVRKETTRQSEGYRLQARPEQARKPSEAGISTINTILSLPVSSRQKMPGMYVWLSLTRPSARRTTGV